MSFYSEVTVMRVVCRNPESVTTADRFAMVCVVTTDTGPAGRIEGKDVYLSPLRLLRKDESASFHDTIFKGFSTEPRIGLVLRAWDKDLNSKWVEFKEDYDKIKKSITDHLDEYPAAGEILGVGVDILKFAADYVVTAVDWFVIADKDDELTNYSTWIDLSDASFETRTKELEIKFSRSDATGYSDWDYSVFFTISYYQTPPGFGIVRPTTWEPHIASTVDDWVGTWVSGDVECRISRSIYANRVNVTVNEMVNAVLVTTETKHAPISKVFVTAGYRELESGSSLDTQHMTAGISSRGGPLSRPGEGPLAVDSPRATPPAGKPLVTNWTVEGLHDKKAWTSELLAGPPVSPYLLRQQVGPDLVRLNNQTVIEMYRILHGDAADVGDRGIRFIRPVPNVLYRDTGFQVQAYLRFKVV
jgi:hypothetical protein